MIAHLQLAEQGSGHRRHAGSLLRHLDGRVLQAAVGHARLLAVEARGGIFGAVIGIARGQEQGLGRFAELAARGAAPDGERGRAPAAGDGGVLSGVTLHLGLS